MSSLKNDKKPKDLKIIGTKEAINKLLKDKVFNNCKITIYIADKINFGRIYRGSTHNEGKQ